MSIVKFDPKFPKFPQIQFRSFFAIIILFCFITSVYTTGCAYDMNGGTTRGYVSPGANEVNIGPTGIETPLERILLIRKDSKYCAVKFTKFWTEKDGKEKFALYDVYYQGDGTGNFSKENVKIRKEKASFLRVRGIGRLFMFQPGNPEVRCENLRLLWDYKGFVCFFERNQLSGDYGIELAPTPWSTIEETNISDPRVRWYRYDINQKYINIPIDQLWESKKNEK